MESRRQARFENKQNELVNKIVAAKGVEMMAGIAAAGFTVATIATACSGASTGVMATKKFNAVASGIYESDKFYDFARAKEKALFDQLTSGEISYDEFKKQHAAIYTTQGVIEYSKTAKDESLSSAVAEYNKQWDDSISTLNEVMPTCLVTAIASGTVCATAEIIRKRNERKLDVVEEQLSEMAD